MPTIQFDSCEGCPYRRDTDVDWDYKSMPRCSKAGRNLSPVRVDLRWDRACIQTLPKWCPLDAISSSANHDSKETPKGKSCESCIGRDFDNRFQCSGCVFFSKWDPRDAQDAGEGR